jgi:hypothetical protein
MLRFLAAALALAAPAALAQVPPSAASGPSRDAHVAGRVVLVEGDALFFDRAGALRSPRVGDRVYEGDRMLTGADGEVHLAMADGGYIGVRPRTELRIDVFKAEGRPADRSDITLIKGSLRTVTGWIGTVGAALIHTFDATIGVRGTDHEPLVIPAGSTRGEPGTYDRVHGGAIFMRTPQGSLDVAAGRTGFVPRGLGLPPEVLRVIPRLYQPTRNEGRFAGLNERVKSQVAKLREQRRSGDRGGQARRSESAERPVRTERAERPERSERPERAERPERPERPDKPDRPEKPERPDKPDKPDRSGRR